MPFEVEPAGALVGGTRVPYPFVCVPGADALSVLAELRMAHPDLSPVAWGDRDDAARLFARFPSPSEREIETALQEAEGSALDLLDAWIAGRISTVGGIDDDDGPPVEADGPLPSPHAVPISLLDYRTGEPRPEILLGLVPTPRPHELAAYHAFGGWKSCPPPAVHTALAREWAARFGARPICNLPDVLEYEIAAPIATREEALELAWVHYRYCSDTVDQLVGSIEGLAATLRGARYWYFWWE
jgi:hypothetical protein